MASSSRSNNICDDDVAKPIGGVVKISAEGTHDQKNHYKAFKFDGNTYELVLYFSWNVEYAGRYCAFSSRFSRTDDKADITQMENKEIMLIAQWFYRPDDATPKRSRKNIELIGARELYYSFHKDEVSAESIVHKCIVHFVTTEKHVPPRKEYPGFIVLEVYDPKSKRLLKLTSNGFKQDFKEEINMLVQKTKRHLGILP
ncbi:putative BAH domain-containing protein [Helianthus debilis subsp. tardiflorus]